jgi:O-antigen/teichoic acid export membrane protein
LNLFKSFSVYLTSSLIEKAIGFLTLPLLTAKIFPESIGKLSLITSTYAFLAPFILISTSGAIYVEYYRNEDRDAFAKYFSTALLINFISCIFFMLIILSGLDWFVEQIGCPKEWVLAIPLFCFFDAVKLTILNLLQIMKKPFYYSLVSLLYTTINFSVSIFLVYQLEMDYQGRLGGIFVSGLITLILSFFLFFKMKLIVFKFKTKFVKDILAYGIPLLPHALGFLVLDLADRFFINKFAGKEELGIYSISYLLSGVTYVLASSFSAACTPLLYDELKKNTPEADLRIVKISYLFILSLFIFCICYILALPLVYQLFINKSYYAGTQYSYLIVSGYFFMSIYLIFSGIIFFRRKNYIFGYIALGNIIINLALNYLLIRYLKAYGAALATCISMFIFMVVIAYFSNRIKPLPWKTGFLQLIQFFSKK